IRNAWRSPRAMPDVDEPQKTRRVPGRWQLAYSRRFLCLRLTTDQGAEDTASKRASPDVPMHGKLPLRETPDVPSIVYMFPYGYTLFTYGNNDMTKAEQEKALARQGSGPLAGIKVIDLTSVLMGPFASQMLGDMGADVTKVEPLHGDLVRELGPARHDTMGPVFLNANRNKRSVVLDLKSRAGMEVMHRLLKGADVLMYNVRPQAMARLGLSYEEVSSINPQIVYAGLYGFGQDGPYAARPAYDDLIQGAAALPHLFARASGGIPRYAP